MARYYFVFQGNNILLNRQGAEPVIGFIALREMRGNTAGEAEKMARIELLKQWKQTFNQDNKAGTPILTLLHSRRIINPLKKVRLSDDFQFFNDAEDQSALADNAIKAGKHWFAIR